MLRDDFYCDWYRWNYYHNVSQKTKASIVKHFFVPVFNLNDAPEFSWEELMNDSFIVSINVLNPNHNLGTKNLEFQGLMNWV